MYQQLGRYGDILLIASPTTTRVAADIVLIADMRAMIMLHNMFESTNVTDFGLFVGVTKGRVNNLLCAVWHLSPSVVALLKGTKVINNFMAFL